MCLLHLCITISFTHIYPLQIKSNVIGCKATKTVIDFKISDEITVNNKWALHVLSIGAIEFRFMAGYRTGRNIVKKTKVIKLPHTLFVDVSGQNGFYNVVIDETVLRNIIGSLIDDLVITADFEEKLLESCAPEDWEGVKVEMADNGLVNRESLTIAQVKLLATLEASELHEITREQLLVACKQLNIELVALSMHLSLTAASREEIELVYVKSPETKIVTVKSVMPKSSRKSMFQPTLSKSGLANIKKNNLMLGDIVANSTIALQTLCNN